LTKPRRRPKKSLGVSSRRAKRKGVGGKEFLPACLAPKARMVGKRFRRFGIKTSKQNNFQFLLKEKWSREKLN